jgi:hypothetical protein
MRLGTGFYLRLENLKGTLLRKALALLTNIRIAKDRHSSLLQTFVNYGCKHKTSGLDYQLSVEQIYVDQIASDQIVFDQDFFDQNVFDQIFCPNCF